MDQDSRWRGLETYISLIESHENKTQFNSVYFVSTTAGNSVPYTCIDSGGINSGAVIPIRFLNKIGGYNTDFFVDAIDDWLILEAKKIICNVLLLVTAKFYRNMEKVDMGSFLARNSKLRTIPLCVYMVS